MTHYRLYRTHRLLTPSDYALVFDQRRMRGNAYFQIFTHPNSLGHPRLGLIVSKKVHKRAVKRNYIKRCLREWFRQHQWSLEAVDFVIRAKRPFSRLERDQAISALSALFDRLRTCHVLSSS